MKTVKNGSAARRKKMLANKMADSETTTTQGVAMPTPRRGSQPTTRGAVCCSRCLHACLRNTSAFVLCVWMCTHISERRVYAQRFHWFGAESSFTAFVHRELRARLRVYTFFSCSYRTLGAMLESRDHGKNNQISEQENP